MRVLPNLQKLYQIILHAGSTELAEVISDYSACLLFPNSKACLEYFSHWANGVLPNLQKLYQIILHAFYSRIQKHFTVGKKRASTELAEIITDNSACGLPNLQKLY